MKLLGAVVIRGRRLFQSFGKWTILSVINTTFQTILINTTFRGVALIRGEVLISLWIPKGAALIWGPALIRGNKIIIKFYNLRVQIFKQGQSSSRQKNDCFFQQVLRQNVRWFLSQHKKTLLNRGFIPRRIKRSSVPLKKDTKDF